MTTPDHANSKAAKSSQPGSHADFPEAAQIERLRQLRLRPEKNLTLTRLFLAEQVQLRRLQRSTGAIAQAWNQTIPAHLLERTSLRSIHNGVVTVAVPSASDRFELDRFLRSGGQRALQHASPTPIRRIKIEIESPNTQPG